MRWAATAFCETEKNFRRVTGYQHLWMLKAHLDDEDGALAEMEKAGSARWSASRVVWRMRWSGSPGSESRSCSRGASLIC